MRTIDRILALLLALVSVVLGVVVVVEVVGRSAGHAGHVLVPWEPVAGFFRGHAWSSAPVLLIAVGLVLVGALLLAVELRSRRTRMLGLQEVTPGVTAALDHGDVPRADLAEVRGRSGSEVRFGNPQAMRTNRLVLLLLGLLMLAAGVLTVVIGVGALPALPSGRAVLAPRIDAWIGGQVWFWPAICAASVLLVVMGVRWLGAQGRSERFAALTVPDGEDGDTQIDASALTDAVVAEIKSYRGVSGVAAQLHGTPAEPRLNLRVDLDGRVAIVAVHERVATEAVGHARAVLSAPDMPVRLLLHMNRPDVRRSG